MTSSKTAARHCSKLAKEGSWDQPARYKKARRRRMLSSKTHAMVTAEASQQEEHWLTWQV